MHNRGLFFLFVFSLDQLSYVEKDEDMGPTLKGENVNCCSCVSVDSEAGVWAVTQDMTVSGSHQVIRMSHCGYW